MSADPVSVLARIAVLEAEINDPVSGSPIYAYSNPPYTISVNDMPLFVNFVGPASSNVVDGSDERGREMLETRVYDLVLYHSPFGAGIEGEKYGLLTAYFDLVYAKFGAYPHLKNVGGVVDARIVSDSGMTTVTYINQTYYGIRFRLQVTARMRRLYGTND